MGDLAHELRNLIHTATLAAAAVKSGKVAIGGATSGVLDRSLLAMSNLIDRSLAEVRITAGLPARCDLCSVASIISEVRISATLEANERKRGFSVAEVDPELTIRADRDLLCAAIGNLLHNAFKFTHDHTEVSLNAYATGDRISIDVSDRCGGLPPGFESKMFLPFIQADSDKSGLGLGLSIAKRGVEACQGELTVRNVPGTGCVFTISLPRN
jgi:signal transduction histidine kinase